MFPPSTIAGYGEASAVYLDIFAMFSDPFCRGIGLLGGDAICCLWREAVVDEDRHRTRAYHQVTHQSFVGREVAQHPAAAMEIHERGQRLLLATDRAHDGQLQIAAVDADRLLTDISCWQGHLRGSLGARKRGTGIDRLHGIERRHTFKRLQEFRRVVLNSRVCGGGGTTRRKSNDRKSESGGKGFHDGSICMAECQEAISYSRLKDDRGSRRDVGVKDLADDRPLAIDFQQMEKVGERNA